MPDNLSPIVILDTKIVRACGYEPEKIGMIFNRLRMRGQMIAPRLVVARLDFLANAQVLDLIYRDKTPIHLPMVRRNPDTPDGLLQIRTVMRVIHESRMPKRT